MFWTWFPYFNLLFAVVAAALWYLFPQLMVWPLLLGLIPWILRFGHEGRWQWRTPFGWPFLLFLITGLVSVWSAYDRQLAWSKFWIIVGGLLLFYAFAAFFLPGAPAGLRTNRTPAWLMALFGTAVTVYFIATHNWADYQVKFAALTSLGLGIQKIFPALPGHRLHPNVVGGILAMMFPFNLIVAWESIRGKQWLSVAIAVILLGITSLGLLLSSSRGAWLALAGALSLGFIWWVSGWFNGQYPGRRRVWFLGISSFLLLAAVVILIINPGILGSAINNLPALSGGTSRLDLFRNSLILVQDYPFIGSGLAGFMMLYSTYAYPLHVGFIIHAHNIYLDVMIEQGVFALLALFWMWGIFVIALWRDSEDGRLRPWLGAAALSLITILLHGFVEDALYGSRSLMLLFLPLAFAIPYPQRQKDFSSSPRWLIPAGGLVVVGMILLLFWRPVGSAALANWGAVQQSRTELSVYERPDWPIQDALRRDIDLRGPANKYTRALAINPQNTTANRRLGQIQLSQGAYDEALAHLQVAYEAMPWDNATRQFIGEAYIVTGQLEEGISHWRTVTNAQNQLNIRAFWYGYIGEEERQEMIEAAIKEINN